MKALTIALIAVILASGVTMAIADSKVLLIAAFTAFALCAGGLVAIGVWGKK